MDLASSQPQVGDVLDDFLLVDELGTGAFARVFLARQRSLQRMVALKISEDRSSEPQTLAQLDHPHIVRVFDQRLLPERDLRLLYMEVVGAGTLDDLVARARATPPLERSGQLLLDTIDQALAKRGDRPPSDSMLRERFASLTWSQAIALLGAQLADGLAYAHDRGVLHRDIKPANVLVAANARAKLADFNIAYHATLDSGGPAAYLGGSMAYMAPEQLEAVSPVHDGDSAALDGRADLYALGMILFELLAGELPFEERDLNAAGGWRPLLEGLVGDRMAGVSKAAWAKLPADTPPLLVDVLRRVLSPDRNARHPNGRELAEALELTLHPRLQTLLTEHPKGWVGRARRHPRVALFLGALVPNVVLTVLNIFYNAHAVVPEAEWGQFQGQVAVVNLVVYAVGISVLLRLGWPFLCAVGRDAEQEPSAEDVRSGFTLPVHTALIVFPLWIAGGFAFPIWQHVQQGAGDTHAYLHFGLSNLLFGVLAAASSFFLIAYGNVRTLLPRMIARLPRTEVPLQAMSDLERQAGVGFIACMGVPLASVTLLSLMAEREQQAYALLGLLGLVAFAFAWPILGALRADITALRDAFRPTVRSE